MHGASLKRTAVFDTYWRFAAERQAMYLRRLSGVSAPWTDDPILQRYRFTNAYRAADRVSQFLISDVQYRSDRSQALDELVFRTLLFKLFNKIETWELLERSVGNLSWQSTDFQRIADVLDLAYRRDQRIYSAAYIMPSPPFGAQRKHTNHLTLLWRMMTDGLPHQIGTAKSLRDVYARILAYPGIGPFLAFQFAIDINYSDATAFDEEEFVVAGPGAVDGIAKCFHGLGGQTPEQVIYWMTEHQDQEFYERGIHFPGLFGRRLQPIDCQNLFCEISKYARVAHPSVAGVSGRSRIKQTYRPASRPLNAPAFPPKWELQVPKFRLDRQELLF